MFSHIDLSGNDSETDSDDPSDKEQETSGNQSEFVQRPLPPSSQEKELVIENDLIVGSWEFQSRSFFMKIKNLFDLVDEAF